jgi:hypothetical protein
LLGAWSERSKVEDSTDKVRLLGSSRERIRTPREAAFAWLSENGGNMRRGYHSDDAVSIDR